MSPCSSGVKLSDSMIFHGQRFQYALNGISAKIASHPYGVSMTHQLRGPTAKAAGHPSDGR